MKTTMFIEGFAESTNLTINEAKTEWAAWSRQLPDTEREQIENKGHVSGMNEGNRYNEWLKSNS